MSQISMGFDRHVAPPTTEAPQIALRPYQEEALGHISDAADRGVRSQLGVAATGLGKQAPLDEPVLTPAGWATMGDLQPGDEVIGVDGKPVVVESIHPQGIQPVVRVTFRDGSWTRCGPEHLWTTRSKHDKYRDRPWRTVTAAELQPGWHIPVVEPVHLDDVPLPIDPYTLGAILGDGSISSWGPTICTDTEIIDHLGWPVDRPHETSPYTSYSKIPKRIVAALDSMGLLGSRSWEKHVPAIYLLGSPGQRLALLRGLMDTDGCTMRNGGAEFASASKALVEAVAELTRSLGGIARNITSRTPTYTYRGERKQGRTSWRVNVKLPADMCPFRLPRKTATWVAPTKYDPAKIVASVEPDGPDVEQVCIKVANPDGLYVTRGYIVTHNTIMFSSLAQRMGVPTLILAHRDELITQAADKMLQVWPGADIGVVKAERNEVDHQVVVASVQTLARAKRREQLPADRFGLVVIDEAHHAKAISYLNIIEHLGAGSEDGPLLVGVTATPDRGDGKGLNDVFDEITFTYDMLWGIRSGYLSDLRGMRVTLDADFSKVKKVRGDYDTGQSGQMLHDADAPSLIADAWLKYASERKTLVFTPTVATAQECRDELRERGVVAEMVSGETPIDERRDILSRYAAGDVRVIANCAVLTEGFDDPDTSCIVVARPTRSRALYTQMIGRGTRRHPGKTDCLVMDVVGASAEHSLVTVPSLFGIKKQDPFEKGEMPVTEAMDEQVEEEIKEGKLKAAEADLFRKVLESPMAWITYNNANAQTCYQISLGDREVGSVVIEPIAVEPEVEAEHGRRYHSYLQWEDGYVPADQGATKRPDGSGFRTLINNVDLEMAQGVGEDFVRKNGAAALTDRNAAWRKRKPTEKQIGAAEKWRMQIDPEWTAGELSDALSAHIAAKKARSRNRPAWAAKKGKR
jgi:superfamily II DNA or RNA helicase